MSAPEGTVGVAVIGAEPADRWASALRGVAGVTVERAAATDDALIEALSSDHIDAVALASVAGDVAAAIKRALMANRHVFVARTPAISPKQLLSLDALARRRTRVLMFDTGTLGDERVDFVRRMTTGPQSLWRARYVRSLRTGAADDSTIDELAIADLSFVLNLLGAVPERVSAVTPRIGPDGEAVDVATLTLLLDGGGVARIDVSLIEPEPRHDVAIACDGRTVLLDAFDARAPLQIQSVGRGTNTRWAETLTEHPVAEPKGRAAGAAAAFITSVRSRDVSASNVRALAVAASVWEAARESIAAGGAMVEIGERKPERRPALKLIVGGGQYDDSYPAPDLKIVPGRPSSAPQDPPDPEPLRSA